MAAAAVIAALALAGLVALALWVRALYRRGEQVPKLDADNKALIEERDTLTRSLEVSRAEAAAERTAAAELRKQLSSSLDTQRRETDAQIHDRPDDAAAQQRIADQLLERPWPGDDPAGP